MTVKLFIQAMGKMVLGIIVVALLLFVPAGSVCYHLYGRKINW